MRLVCLHNSDPEGHRSAGAGYGDLQIKVAAGFTGVMGALEKKYHSVLCALTENVSQTRHCCK